MREFSFFDTQPFHLLDTLAFQWIRLCSTFCDFPIREQVEISSIKRSCWFSWLIFVQHGLYGILLTLYSALSRLTDHGIYYITRCRIWLLTIFHILCIHFQQELRKVTPPKWYLSFFVQYTWSEVKWLLNVTINNISVIYMYVTVHRCAGGLKKKLYLRSGSQHHRYFVGFFNGPVQATTRGHPFYTVIPRNHLI